MLGGWWWWWKLWVVVGMCVGVGGVLHIAELGEGCQALVDCNN